MNYDSDLKMLEMPEPGNTCQGELSTGSSIGCLVRCMLQAVELETYSHLI